MALEGKRATAVPATTKMPALKQWQQKQQRCQHQNNAYNDAKKQHQQLALPTTTAKTMFVAAKTMLKATKTT